VSVHNLFDAIAARREISLERFIHALGIRHVGETTARVLARAYKIGAEKPSFRKLDTQCPAAFEARRRRGLEHWPPDL